MTSQGKEIHDYKYLAHCLKEMGVNNLIYGTDGELAMEDALETYFPVESHENIHL